MEGVGYFTLPVGQLPDTADGAFVCNDAVQIPRVFQSSAEDGPYMLYQGFVSDGVLCGSVPMYRVQEPFQLVEKLKVYLDTSAISYLRQEDAPEQMADTLAFWERLKSGTCLVYLSDITLDEVYRCPEPRLSSLIDFLGEVEYTVIRTVCSTAVDEMVTKIKALDILPQRSVADISHIAAALTFGCDVIASWNFKHLVNERTVDGIRTVAVAGGYKPVGIQSPKTLLEVLI